MNTDYTVYLTMTDTKQGKNANSKHPEKDRWNTLNRSTAQSNP